MLLGVGAAPPGRALGRLGAGLGNTAAAVRLAGPPLTSGSALAVRLLAAPVNLHIKLCSGSLTISVKGTGMELFGLITVIRSERLEEEIRSFLRG
jgi:hypothetical protein